VLKPSIMTTTAIIGAGPAGLIAAEYLARSGHSVAIYDRMPSPGRKFLLAGRGGLNLTHSEPLDQFIPRYGEAANWLAPSISAFPPAALCLWAQHLGQTLFVGTSGRIFPTSLKAAPLLRAWHRRLAGLGVSFHPHHTWLGWTERGELRFTTPTGDATIAPAATLLALGGASWPRLGSDGGWVEVLRARGVAVADLQPANCGVCMSWSPIFIAKHAGAPLNRIAVTCAGHTVHGEAVITQYGLQGGAIYPLIPWLRPALAANGHCDIFIDLKPGLAPDTLAARLDRPRQARSLSNFLRAQAGLSPAAIGLVQEALHASACAAPLGALIKAVPLRVTRLPSIARAISSAGGIARAEVTADFMLARLPGVFAAGEMLDWEAPTGGYLLQACFSTGLQAARGVAGYLARVPQGAGTLRARNDILPQ
jgi:uncharacterized flavoprotein (TIGR03862 family)